MNTFNRLAALSAMALLVGVSGCVVAPGHDRDRGYRYEHGDRIDRDGHREIRWCDDHRGDEHCR